MAYHAWGDREFDWKGLDVAINYISDYLVKWGRINVGDAKEKFGCARIYCTLGWYQLHCITHPGYHYNQYPKWLWILDIRYISKLVRLLNVIVIPWQRYVYRTAYRKAVSKWPHLREEIIQDADYTDLLTGI